MKFYNRKSELNELKILWNQVHEQAKMAVLTGRRRIGKTLLALEFSKDLATLYLFVEKKSEILLCEEWLMEIKKFLSLPIIGEITRFKDLFRLILEISKKKKILLIIDEFQEFFHINAAVFSEMQHLWDLHKNEAKLCVLVIGSVYSMMIKIFQHSGEPLFGRADRIFKINAFDVLTMSKLLRENSISATKSIFDFFVVTGGMPKYIDLFISNSVRTWEGMLKFMLRDFSPFLDEGKFLLIEEFGRDYSVYFSILELISIGKTSRPEIESILERNVGGYIERLENDYDVIVRRKPFGEKPSSRLIKYSIKDNFLNFWFRFFYRNRQAIEMKNFAYVIEIINRDYTTYCGKYLEAFLCDLLINSGKYNAVGSYWEKGNQNEIDIVATNDLEKRILIAEVKWNPKKLNLSELKQKSYNLLRSFTDYHVDFAVWSLKDADQMINQLMESQFLV